jgi:hypothetical protein
MQEITLGQKVLVRYPEEVWLGEVVNTLPGISGWTRVRFQRAYMREGTVHPYRTLPGWAVKDVATEKLVTA